MKAYHPWIISNSGKLMTTLISYIWIVLLHYINTITVNITFYNHSCLHYIECVGSFKAHIELLHISSIPPSWKKTYMHTHHLHKNILKPIVGVWDFLSNSFLNKFIKVQGNLKDHFIKTSSQAIKQIKWKTKWTHHMPKW
jgi:hypothetical protein